MHGKLVSCAIRASCRRDTADALPQTTRAWATDLVAEGAAGVNLVFSANRLATASAKPAEPMKSGSGCSPKPTSAIASRSLRSRPSKIRIFAPACRLR